MGWIESHLHGFKIGVVCASFPDDPGHLKELTAVDPHRSARLPFS
jgi:hypothetical protein